MVDNVIHKIIISLVALFFTASNAVCADNDSDKNVAHSHKILVQNFLVGVDDIYDYSIALLVKKKSPFIRGGMSEEYNEKSLSETSRVSEFIRNLKGTITIYSTPNQAIVYELTLPNENAFKGSAQTWVFGMFGTEWDGITLPQVPITQPGYYIIETEIYSNNEEYQDLMLSFNPINGTK